MKHEHRHIANSRGFVLITVLLIVVLLTALLLEFNYASRTHLQAADSFSTRLQALNCARAGLNIAIAAINKNPDIRTNRTLRTMLSGLSVYDIDPGRCSLKLTEENGKININMLRDHSGRLDRVRIDQLLRLIDLLNQNIRKHSNRPLISYSLVPAIIDWTDPDEQVTVLPFVSRENIGAESDYYKTSPTPCKCKNQPFENLEELSLVKGMTAEILHGETFQNKHFQNDEPFQNNEQNSIGALSDYLTVCGDGKIDINCAPALVIQSLSEHIDPALAQMVVDRRKDQPFSSIAQLRDFPGLSSVAIPATAEILTTDPTDRYYKITASGSVNQICVTITAIIKTNSVSQNTEIILYKEL